MCLPKYQTLISSFNYTNRPSASENLATLAHFCYSSLVKRSFKICVCFIYDVLLKFIFVKKMQENVNKLVFPPAPQKGMVKIPKKGTFSARLHAKRALLSTRRHAKRAL